MTNKKWKILLICCFCLLLSACHNSNVLSTSIPSSLEKTDVPSPTLTKEVEVTSTKETTPTKVTESQNDLVELTCRKSKTTTFYIPFLNEGITLENCTSEKLRIIHSYIAQTIIEDHCNDVVLIADTQVASFQSAQKIEVSEASDDLYWSVISVTDEFIFIGMIEPTEKFNILEINIKNNELKREFELIDFEVSQVSEFRQYPQNLVYDPISNGFYQFHSDGYIYLYFEKTPSQVYGIQTSDNEGHLLESVYGWDFNLYQMLFRKNNSTFDLIRFGNTMELNTGQVLEYVWSFDETNYMEQELHLIGTDRNQRVYFIGFNSNQPELKVVTSEELKTYLFDIPIEDFQFGPETEYALGPRTLLLYDKQNPAFYYSCQLP